MCNNAPHRVTASMTFCALLTVSALSFSQHPAFLASAAVAQVASRGREFPVPAGQGQPRQAPLTAVVVGADSDNTRGQSVIHASQWRGLP